MTLLDVHETSMRHFDPRIRLLWMLWVSIAAITFRSLGSFAWLIVVLLGIWISAGVLREMLNFTLRALPLALFLVILTFATALVQRYGIWIVLTRPDVWVPGRADMRDATVKAIRFLVMISSAKLLFLTTDFAEISGGIRSLQRSWFGQRLNTFIEIFAFVIGFSFQSVPLIINEMAAVIEAERGRGVDVNAGSRVAQIQNYLRMVPTLILRCLTIGQFTIMAMINFRFNPFRPRTMYRRFMFARHDWIALSIILLSLVLIALLKQRYPEIL